MVQMGYKPPSSVWVLQLIPHSHSLQEMPLSPPFFCPGVSSYRKQYRNLAKTMTCSAALTLVNDKFIKCFYLTVHVAACFFLIFHIAQRKTGIFGETKFVDDDMYAVDSFWERNSTKNSYWSADMDTTRIMILEGKPHLSVKWILFTHSAWFWG